MYVIEGLFFFNSEKKQGQHANSEKGTLKVHCDYSDLMF